MACMRSDQATRGKTVFEATCVGCHGVDLAGLSGPELAGDRFRTRVGLSDREPAVHGNQNPDAS